MIMATWSQRTRQVLFVVGTVVSLSLSALVREAAAQVAPSERQALIDLYNATGGASWTTRTNWRNAANTDFNDPGTECTWFRVTCDAGQTTVQGLTPYNDNLVGTIPASLEKLTNLLDLNLSRNHLAGAIPSELSNLSKLQNLNLWSNQLAGQIPTSLGNLTNLKSLGLGSNQLTGPIPEELGNLTNLAQLSLNSSQLTGSIPPGLGSLTNLWDLEMGWNQLTGPIPPQLGNLTNLVYLELFHNQLTGPIPPQLGNLTKLRDLGLSFNLLTGSIPVELCTFTNMDQGLGLGHNQLTGGIPTGIGNLARLDLLDLSSNLLTGPIPSGIGNLKGLESLYLGGNQLLGSIPSEIGNLTYLQFLDLSSNQLVGPVPSSIANLRNLFGDFSDFRWNGLYSADAAVVSFLNRTQDGGDWQSTQTVPVTGLGPGVITASSVELSWTPITYVDGTGGYRAYYSTASGGPYTSDGITTDKSDSSIVVSGLDPKTLYYFVIRTVTNPHASNQNTVTSDPSDEVHATTSATCTPPLITAQPKSQSIQSGQTATLFVTATGTTPLSYQWYQGDTSHPVGTNSSSFTTPTLTSATSYWVRASNACGFAVSATTIVTISGCTSPSITSHPQSQPIVSGQTATLSVAATGTEPLSYRWYQGNTGDASTPVGTDASTFTTPPLESTTSYWVWVFNACGTADSATATISVERRARRHLQRAP